MLVPGTRLGAYEVVAKLGEGGMGEVYRATDTKLGRAVAIKVLPDAFLADPERVPRFEREAKVLASLNHPHIAALYGMDESDGRHFLVMELVEGETLADRLQSGALSVDETLQIAGQIADALDAAHEQGIVHRDLKPANVKITPDGKVKVLDFGLAKAADNAPAAQNITRSPTLSVMATQAGMIMGTAAYMSPEQAKGLPVDRRSDVFSFGVVLYEMLTGRQPFGGDTAAEVMASIMLRDADIGALPQTIPPRLREVVTRCLDKRPRQRWQSMGDLRVELETLQAAPTAPTTTPQQTPAATRTTLWKRLLPVAAAIVFTAAATTLVMKRQQPAPLPEAVRFTISAPDMRLSSNNLAIAPGGAAVAYTVLSPSGSMLMVRYRGEFGAKPIESTSGLPVSHPAFSPDGQSVAFVTDQQIRRVDLRGGDAVTIARLSQGARGLSWRGSSLMFAVANVIYRVADTGGEPEPVVQLEEGQIAGHPQALDDNGTLLYVARTGGPNLRVGGPELPWQVVLQTPSGARTVLADDAVSAYYVEPDRVVFMRNGTLMAMRVDLRTGKAISGEVAVVEGITRLLASAANPTFHVAVSQDGTLAYVPGSIGRAARGRLAFVHFDGRVEPLPIPPHYYGQPRLSPDGRQVAVESDDGKEAVVWVGPVAGGAPLRRLTFDGRNAAPVWTRDGQYLSFQSDREGVRGVFLQRADGSTPAVRLTRAEPGSEHVPESWSPDDRFLTIRVVKDRASSIWIAARDGSEFTPFVENGARIIAASAFSPDGRWVAYGSNEIKAYNIFVQPFPATGIKYQLTTDATSTPVWSPDGKQLFYAYADRIFRADVLNSGGLSLGTTTTLETIGSLPSLPTTRNFDVAPDGKRVLVVMPEGADGAQRTTINVVLNWAGELGAKLPQ